MAGSPGDEEPFTARGFARDSLYTGVGAVCDTATRLSGVDGAAVAVFAPSRSRELVYATDALAQQIDDLQFTLGEGPCLDAYHAGLPQSCPRLDTLVPFSRWPAFCEGAMELGAHAVFAFPVLTPTRALGVLELYRATVGELDSGQHASASMCASAVADTLLANWTSHLAGAADAVAAIEAASVDPSGAIDFGNQFSRARVYIASGMVAVQLRVSADEALDRLRAYTYAQSRSITDVAADIVAKRLSLRGFRGGFDADGFDADGFDADGFDADAFGADAFGDVPPDDGKDERPS